MSITADHTIKQGGSLAHTFTAKDEDGDVIDLTGYTITAKAWFKDAPAQEGKVTMAVVNTDLPNGQFTVQLTAAQTGSMTDGIWEFDAKLVNGATTLGIAKRSLRLLPFIT